MKELPKKCLTCKFMEFVDDELTMLMCTITKEVVSDDDICDSYEVNKAVIEDAEQGCW